MPRNIVEKAVILNSLVLPQLNEGIVLRATFAFHGAATKEEAYEVAQLIGAHLGISKVVDDPSNGSDNVSWYSVDNVAVFYPTRGGERA